MAVLIHRLPCPVDIESGHPDQESYEFDMPLVSGTVGVEYKNGAHYILAVCDRTFTLLNPAVSTTYTWRLEGQAPPAGTFIGATVAEGTGDTIFWWRT